MLMRGSTVRRARSCIMRADEVPGLLHEFLSRNRELFGELAVAPSPPADPARFPNEVHKLQPFSSGVYLFHRKVSGDLLYVGTAVNIRNRIYRHFGKGVSYETSA